MFQHRVPQRVNGLAGTHVAGVTQCAAAQRFDFGAGLRGHVFAASGGNHVGAGLRQSNGQGSTDAGRTTHHDGHAAAQIHEVGYQDVPPEASVETMPFSEKSQ
jgi:hypothetical protein